MKAEKRINKDGSSYFSFVTSDRRRLTREQIRTRFGKDILTEEEAEKCLKLLSAEHEAKKIRIEKRLAWEKEFYNFSKMLDEYTVKQKKRAPNSWENNVFYLRHYTLKYFLQVKKLNNIALWSDHFEAFRDWLETAKTLRSNRVISYSSKNHAIKSLNTFLEHLEREKIIETTPKCEAFGEHLINKRTVDDIVHPHEMEAVYKALIELGHTVEARFFRYLYFSGMRFNEGLCISVGDLFQGEIENEFIRKKMKAYELEYFGYIVSDGQFGGFGPNNEVLRVPFKGQKVIDEKFNRIVPITDKELWNTLVDVAEKKFATADERDARDLLLFEGIDDTTATVRLMEAFEKAKLKYRTWHCLRHSRATWLIGETGDAMLARVFLGHTSPKTIEKYNHLWQQIVRAAKSVKSGKGFALKKV